jgi:hypothetical protein
MTDSLTQAIQRDPDNTIAKILSSNIAKEYAGTNIVTDLISEQLLGRKNSLPGLSQDMTTDMAGGAPLLNTDGDSCDESVVMRTGSRSLSQQSIWAYDKGVETKVSSSNNKSKEATELEIFISH